MGRVCTEGTIGGGQGETSLWGKAHLINELQDQGGLRVLRRPLLALSQGRELGDDGL